MPPATRRRGSVPSQAAARAAFLTLALVSAAGPGCASTHPAASIPPREEAPPPAPPGALPTTWEEPDVPEGVFHRVEPGQTVWRIAKAYGASWEELARVNRIARPSSLRAGALLFVPGARETIHVPAYPAPLPSRAAASPSVPARPGLLWPVPGGAILSYYGAPRAGHRHSGLDIRGPLGQDVLAADAGEVVYSGDTLGGYGKMVIIEHGGGLQSLYAHNSELLVGVGDVVERGTRVARIGRSGNASTEHCHFEVRKDKAPVDPLLYFPASADGQGGDARILSGRRERRSASGSGQ